ncbi:MAG: sigma-70 family RNA polymerase sigma factor [Muribaculaceae bacterium]|nr:sigma-70 family RNA polymerase sigma factor [Muribaculaceae bacterium]
MMNQDIEKEFEDAIAEYGGIITKICYYFSTNTDEFKDLRQEVLYYLWKGWTKFRGDASLSTWIYRVCFNTCISYQRKEQRSKNKVPIEEALFLPAENDSEYLERYRTMHKLIGRLNYEDRAIILMWLDEKNYEEISEMMGINRNTIATRLKRIKEKLERMNPEKD